MDVDMHAYKPQAGRLPYKAFLRLGSNKPQLTLAVGGRFWEGGDTVTPCIIHTSMYCRAGEIGGRTCLNFLNFLPNPVCWHSMSLQSSDELISTTLCQVLAY